MEEVLYVKNKKSNYKNNLSVMKNSDNIGGDYNLTFHYVVGDVEKGLVEKIR